jgi:hypothetical protein
MSQNKMSLMKEMQLIPIRRSSDSNSHYKCHARRLNNIGSSQSQDHSRLGGLGSLGGLGGLGGLGSLGGLRHEDQSRHRLGHEDQSRHRLGHGDKYVVVSARKLAKLMRLIEIGEHLVAIGKSMVRV